MHHVTDWLHLKICSGTTVRIDSNQNFVSTSRCPCKTKLWLHRKEFSSLVRNQPIWLSMRQFLPQGHLHHSTLILITTTQYHLLTREKLTRNSEKSITNYGKLKSHTKQATTGMEECHWLQFWAISFIVSNPYVGGPGVSWTPTR